MVRVVNSGVEQKERDPYLGIALRDAVNADIQMNKFLEDVEERDYAPLSREEQLAMEDEIFARELAEMFELDPDSIGEGHEDHIALIESIADQAYEGVVDTIEELTKTGQLKDPDVRRASIEEHTVGTKQALLDEEFEERSSKKFESLVKQRPIEGAHNEEPVHERMFQSKPDSLYDEIRENGHTDFTSKSRSGYGAYETREEKVSSQYNSSTTTVFDREKREKQTKDMYSRGANSMRNMAFSGREKVKKKKKRNPYGKKRFSIKNVWKSTKEWFHSDEAVLLSKIGVMLCLETGMAIVTKQHEFEGTGQMLAFLAMMLGVFYISREIRAEGFDPRKVSMI